MESDTNIPCATCLLWNPEKKSFSCDPNTCKRLSNWLLKHANDNADNTQNKTVQYVV
jgi:hypothetical protein